jgi:ATP-binding cassette, subfamily F, member 3
MITLQDLQLHFGARPIFDGVTATILIEDRIGLVGVNGAGKTTLLKTLAGEQELDGGKIVYGPHIRIGYLPQDGLHAQGRTVFEEVESAAEEILTLRKKQAELDAALAALPANGAEEQTQALIAALADVDDELFYLGNDLLTSEVETILLGLGFKVDQLSRQTSELSGGWQMRVGLAKLLLAKPQLLLLDEPTNHLDLPSQRWLERFLMTYPGALMVISHDQAFLDTLCTKIYELSRGNLTVYTANYSEYEEQKEARALALKSAYESQQKKLAKTQDFIDRFRAKASKAAQVQSRIKAMAKVERIEIGRGESSIGFRFLTTTPTGQKVLTIKGIGYSYGKEPLFDELDAVLEKGEKVALVGPNGAGKSTLMKLFAGALDIQKGTREIGHNVQMAYFAQHQTEALDLTKTVIETASDWVPSGSKVSARSVLGSFLFTGDDAFKPVRVLSGGEKNRLALAKILLSKANCLLLDEPTNHLDIASKRVLQAAVKHFDGASIIISHDRAFLDPLVSKVWEIRNGKLHVFHGNVSAYLAWSESQPSEESPSKKKSTEAKPAAKHFHPKDFQKAQAMSNKRLQELELLVKECEAIKEALENELAVPDFFKSDPVTAHAKVKEHVAASEALEKAWAEWTLFAQEHAEAGF